MGYEITVTMIFDEKGDLAAVKPVNTDDCKIVAGPDEPLPVAAIRKGHDKLKLHSFLYEFGSPGCVTYWTKAGWTQVCW